VAWMYCMHSLGVVTTEDFPALVLRVFNGYLSLMRRLQEHYWLEPAGSHGVWGLDDYHFLPFLWGSAQLIGHKHIFPKSIRSSEIVEGFSREYMYLSCIQFVVRVKTGALVEHSPMLVDISGVKTWNKVNEGMIKMYKAEFLHRFPVMQHFIFGTFLPFKPEIHSEACHMDHEHPKDSAHTHSNGQFPTCCISRLPSAFAYPNTAPRPVLFGID